MLEVQPWQALEELLGRSGFAADSLIPKLEAYAELLLEWNRSVSNLVSHKDEERFVERHLAESLAPAAAARDLGAAKWLDLGSGGGLPAIPMALAGIGESWTLVESRRMKTLFLEKAVDELGLKQVEIVRSRLEALVEDAEESGPQYDAFTSRATLRLAPTLEMAKSFVRPGGAALLWKGERFDEERSSSSEWTAHWTQGVTIPTPNPPTSIVLFNRK